MRLVVLAIGKLRDPWVLAGCAEYEKRLANRRSHRWFRVFNEMSVLLFAGAVVLVVVRPF